MLLDPEMTKRQRYFLRLGLFNRFTIACGNEQDRGHENDGIQQYPAPIHDPFHDVSPLQGSILGIRIRMVDPKPGEEQIRMP